MSKTCRKCQKEFNKPYFCSKKEWITRIYCSHSCANSINSLNNKHSLGRPSPNRGKPNPLFNGENNPKWNGGLVIKECNVCNKEFRVKPYRKDTAKFCSHKCSEIVRDEGKTPLYKRIRKSKEYIAWREGVFFRDDYQCQLCNKRGGELQADHIKPFALYPELRFAIDNGRALCVDCHKTTDTWGYRSIYRVTSATEA